MAPKRKEKEACMHANSPLLYTMNVFALSIVGAHITVVQYDKKMPKESYQICDTPPTLLEEIEDSKPVEI